jgi:multidrug efflux pump subunit AcrA (membrane-fusion protein)
MRSVGLWATILIALAALAVSLWNSGSPTSAQQNNQETSARVRRDKFVRSLIVSGELSASRAVRITAPPFRSQGPFSIKALPPEGSTVRPGDLLLQIDNSVLVNNLSTEELELERAENDLVKKQAELEIQVKDLEMQLAQNKLQLDQTKLKADISQELISVRDFQDNQFAYQKAKKEYDKTLQSLELARKASTEEVDLLRLKRQQIKSGMELTKSGIQSMEMRADRPGTVLYEIYPPSRWNNNEMPRKFQVGDQVFSGWTVLSIPDLQDMEVRAFVSEVDGGMLRTGQRARIITDSRPDMVFDGTVEHVPELAERYGRSSNVRIFNTTIRLDKTDQKFMRPGMSVQVEIFLDERQGLVLPRRAVKEEQGKFYVTLDSGSRQEIRVLGRNSKHFLIEGLSEGTIVKL